jgi:HSP20 family protein
MPMNRTINRWNPLRELEDFQQRILSAFNSGHNRNGHPDHNGGSKGEEALTTAEWMPLVDIIEDEKQYIIAAELPDVRKEDVKVTMENGVLNVRGERRFERESETAKFHRVERSYGTFARSFTIPDDGDSSTVTADFRDGMLKIRIGKSEAAKPKQIEVKVG